MISITATNSNIAEEEGDNDNNEGDNDETEKVESLAASIAETAGHKKTNHEEEENVVVEDEESIAALAATTQGGSAKDADAVQATEGGGGGGEASEVTDIRVDNDTKPGASSANNNYDSIISSGTAIQVSTDEVEAQLINAYYDGRKKVKRDSEDPSNKPYRPMKEVAEKEF